MRISGALKTICLTVKPTISSSLKILKVVLECLEIEGRYILNRLQCTQTRRKFCGLFARKCEERCDYLSISADPASRRHIRHNHLQSIVNFLLTLCKPLMAVHQPPIILD